MGTNYDYDPKNVSKFQWCLSYAICDKMIKNSPCKVGLKIDSTFQWYCTWYGRACTENMLEASVNPICEVEGPTCNLWILWKLEHFCIFLPLVQIFCTFLEFLSHTGPKIFWPSSSQNCLLNMQSSKRICPWKKFLFDISDVSIVFLLPVSW